MTRAGRTKAARGARPDSAARTATCSKVQVVPYSLRPKKFEDVAPRTKTVNRFCSQRLEADEHSERFLHGPHRGDSMETLRVGSSATRRLATALPKMNANFVHCARHANGKAPLQGILSCSLARAAQTEAERVDWKSKGFSKDPSF